MTQEPDHKARKHSRLGASICYRWWNCPGSVAATEGEPNVETEASRRGTAAHELAEICLDTGTDADTYFGDTISGVEIDQQIVDGVQVYLDDCRETIAAGARYWTEVQFDLTAFGPPEPMFGTADFVAYDEAARRLYVKDYKNGFLHVDEGTPQLRYYAVGALLWLSDQGHDPAEVEVTIVQPNGVRDAVRRVTYTATELAGWSIELIQRANATREPDAPLVPGDWCDKTFCPIRGKCRARADAALAQADVDFGAFIAAPLPAPLPSVEPLNVALATLTPEELGALKARLPMLEAFIKAVDTAIEGELRAGRDVPGWKMVAGEKHRVWSDAPGAQAALMDQGVDPWAEPKMLTPAQAEAALADKLPGKTKTAKKEAARATLVAFTTKPPGEPKLVPASHPAPALTFDAGEFNQFITQGA